MTGYLISIGYGYYNAKDGYFRTGRGTNCDPTIFASKATAKRHMELIPARLRSSCKIIKIVEVAG